ncbi:MAG: hypothetical protein IPG86_02025 [Chitinophagaceae bacterium]|nr:hypothetical protein [Chitinophagaceae bacterium]
MAATLPSPQYCGDGAALREKADEYGSGPCPGYNEGYSPIPTVLWGLCSTIGH